MLSFGKTWESACPVAFDSMQFKNAELNYPVHEKELLAIVRALKKWRSDLLGTHIYVYTDHRTLENFETQRDLSHRQLRWQELLSQFDITIVYIRGEDNTVADALSRVPVDTFPSECEPMAHEAWAASGVASAVLQVCVDEAVLQEIKLGYAEDEFAQHALASSMPGFQMVNGLLYVGSQLVILRVGNIRENLFRLAHDCLGHFGADKSYGALQEAYYWPNMRRDLEKGYIPGCTDCQQNKLKTSKAAGLLHLLPIPERHGDSVAIDFIGPC